MVHWMRSKQMNSSAEEWVEVKKVTQPGEVRVVGEGLIDWPELELEKGRTVMLKLMVVP